MLDALLEEMAMSLRSCTLDICLDKNSGELDGVESPLLLEKDMSSGPEAQRPQGKIGAGYVPLAVLDRSQCRTCSGAPEMLTAPTVIHDRTGAEWPASVSSEDLDLCS